jgi:hypothetical protein
MRYSGSASCAQSVVNTEGPAAVVAAATAATTAATAATAAAAVSVVQGAAPQLSAISRQLLCQASEQPQLPQLHGRLTQYGHGAVHLVELRLAQLAVVHVQAAAQHLAEAGVR